MQLIASTVNYRYVDETAEIVSYYSVEPDQDISPSSLAPIYHDTLDYEEQTTPFSITTSDAVTSNSPDNLLPPFPKRRRLDSQLPRPLIAPDEQLSACSNLSPLPRNCYGASTSSHVNLHPTNDAVISPQLQSDGQEACLMRYFVVQLAHCVSLLDLYPAALLSFLNTLEGNCYVDIFYSSIYVTALGTSPRSFHCEQKHVPLYSTRFIRHQQGT